MNGTHPDHDGIAPLATQPSADFEIYVASLGGIIDPSLPIAGARAGAWGLLDLTLAMDVGRARCAVERLVALAGTNIGLILNVPLAELESAALAACPHADVIVLSPADADLHATVALCRQTATRIGLLAYRVEDAAVARDAGVDFIIAKGNEAGGIAGAETTFHLTNRLLAGSGLPVVAWGGVDFDTVAACRTAGAAGIVVDWQLALVRESPLPPEVRERIESATPGFTTIIPGPLDRQFRFDAHNEITAKTDLTRLAAELGPSDPTAFARWRDAMARLVAHRDSTNRLWAVGQDASSASLWSEKVPCVARALSLLRSHAEEAANQGDGVRVTAEPSAPAEPAPPALEVAIVGMGCLLPGANEIRAFWENVLRKRDMVREVPADRFQSGRWFDGNKNARDKMYSKWGGFLNDIPFDPLKYGIPPKAIASIEPAQLLTLELVDQALRDAGYSDQNPFAQRTSVILGAGGGMGEMGTAYAFRAMLPHYVEDPDETLWSQFPEWTEDSFPGFLLNVISGRVSNRFDLGGVNYTVDAACASSLAAVYLACRELTDCTSDLAIAGGVDTMQHPFSFMAFSKTNALSPSGRSRPFDASADGIAISEGLAAVVLKRLDDAERDGDRVYAVIRAIAGGSDGRHKSLTAPSSRGQARTVRRTYAQAGYSPATCDLFEAHGTGTSVGDQTECETLNDLLAAHGAAPKSKAIGSVKSMIGHTKSTAGVTGLIKATLSLYHRVLPPTLNVESPNQKGGFGKGPLYVNAELRPWIRGRNPRRAGISAFGFGGTNFHATLEEYDRAPLEGGLRSPCRWRLAELFAFRASSAETLLAQVRSLSSVVRRAAGNNARPELAELAYAWHCEQRVSSGARRACIVSRTVDELGRQLEILDRRLSATGESDAAAHGIYVTEAHFGPGTPIAFLFPGQGSQHPDMLRDLAVEFGEVAECFAQADAVLGDALGRPLSRFVFPPPAFSEAERSAAFEELTATDVAQPALGVCGMAMLKLLDAFGVAPDLVAGHSYGELVALFAAGAFDADTLLRLSQERAAAMLGMTAGGRDVDLGQMLAVSADADAVQQTIANCENVWLANLNGPKQTIISGTRAGLADAATRLNTAGIFTTAIPVACAFHSPLMQGARERFGEALNRAAFQPAVLPVYSNVTADVYPADAAAGRGLLLNQLVNRVRFVEQVEAMYAAGARIFVEVGPGCVLTKLVKRILEGRPHQTVVTQPKEGQGVTSLLGALAQLFVDGCVVDWERLYNGRHLVRQDLESLAESKSKPFGPQMWLINGGYSRPASAPARVLKPGTRLEPKATPLPPPVQPAGEPATAPQPYASAKPVTQAIETFSEDDGAVFAKFQETMQRFLATQQAVMEAFFGGTVGSLPAEQAMPGEVHPFEASRIPSPPEQRARVDDRTAAPADFAHSASVTTSKPGTADVVGRAAGSTPEAVTNVLPSLQPDAVDSAATSLLDQLLAIVSDRTGYPSEMLDMDADMEAELGIDSIKRVEILSAFRKQALWQVDESPASFTEKMTSARTLNGILAGVEELVGALLADSPSGLDSADQAKAGQAPPVPVEGQSILEVLFGIVSERTGYPAEMLDADADMEADLGIDSIKRVEIITEFRRVVLPPVEEPPSGFMEAMTQAKTMNEIVASAAQFACGPRDRSATPPAVDQRRPEPVRVEEPATRAPRCVGTVVEVAVRPGDAARLPGGVFVVTDDGDGIAAMFQAKMEAEGGRAIVLDPRVLESRDSTQAAVDKIRETEGRIGGLVHLLPLRPGPSFPGITTAVWNHYADPEIKGMLYLVQSVVRELGTDGDDPMLVAAMSVGGGDFPPLLRPTHPWRGGLSGLLKSAECEWPNARFRCINLRDVAIEPLLDILRGAYSPSCPVDVAYVDGRRYAVHAVRAELPSEPPASETVELDSNDVVLVVGGARGITAEVVQELAERTTARFVLLGRSMPPGGPEDPRTAGITEPAELRRLLSRELCESGQRPTPREVVTEASRILAGRELRRTLSRLKQTGASVEYVRCDARNDDELIGVVKQIQQRLGPITVVIHGAGRIEDRLIIDKTAESFDRVTGTKTEPLLTLSRILDPDRLKFVMLFSSVSGFFGNPGQADYAAANEMLNRMASRLSGIWPAKVVAMNWGPWAGSGMVTPEVARQFRSRNIELVPVAAGRRAAWQELWLPGDDVRVVIGEGPWVPEADRLAAQLAESGRQPVLWESVRSGLDRVDTAAAAGR